jgi:hypothetical protein
MANITGTTDVVQNASVYSDVANGIMTSSTQRTGRSSNYTPDGAEIYLGTGWYLTTEAAYTDRFVDTDTPA